MEELVEIRPLDDCDIDLSFIYHHVISNCGCIVLQYVQFLLTGPESPFYLILVV